MLSSTKWNLLLKLPLLIYFSESHLPFRKNTSCQPYLPYYLALQNYLFPHCFTHPSMLHAPPQSTCHLLWGYSQILGIFPKTLPAPDPFISWSYLVPISHSTLSSHFLVILCSLLALDFCTFFLLINSPFHFSQKRLIFQSSA